MVSSFRADAFNGGTPDLVDPGGVILVGNKRVGSGQGAVKEWVPRTVVKRNEASSLSLHHEARRHIAGDSPNQGRVSGPSATRHAHSGYVPSRQDFLAEL